MPVVRIRFSLGAALAFLLLGILIAAVGAADGSISLLVLGPLLVLLGVLQLTGVAVVVEPHEVQVRNPLQMTMRRVPVQGLGDLVIEGSRLLRRTDGRKITAVGALSARSADVEELRAAIARAGGPS